MYALSRSTTADESAERLAPNVAPRDRQSVDAASERHRLVLYIDPRAMTRDCVGGWLRANIRGCDVCILSDTDEIEAASMHERPQAVVLNAGAERVASAALAGRLAGIRGGPPARRDGESVSRG